MNIKIYDQNNIDDLVWKITKDGNFSKNYLYNLVKYGINKYIDNVDSEMVLLSFDDNILPLVFGNPDQKIKNSYVCSPTSHYIDYGREECEIELKNNPFLKKFTLAVIDVFDYLFKKMNFENVLYINNWLLSTNLYEEFDLGKMKEIKDFLIDKFPRHTLVFKSINDIYNKDLYNKLNSIGFNHVLSRQVYINDQKNGIYKKKRSFQRDRTIKKKSLYYWENSDKITENDYKRIKELYKLLYIDKYSSLNPVFNEKFISETIKNNCFTYKVLKKDNIIYGVFGYFERFGVITAPLFGYDTSISEEDGLYRLVCLEIFEDAIKNNWIIHQSSGVSKFKMYRGAESSIEYNMAYYKHVTFKQKIPWIILEKLTDYVVIPVMKKYKL